MFSRCLPYAETEKAESSLWENRRFLFPVFLRPLFFILFLICVRFFKAGQE